MTISVVLADANILFSRTLRDYFLHAAAAGALEIHWSQQILDEMSRNLRGRLGLSFGDTRRLESLMNAYIEYALIQVEVSDLAAVQSVDMDPKDRHVLAAALHADADVLVTDNIKHFPKEWMADHGIELLDAASLLGRLAELFPDQLREAHEKTVQLSRLPEEAILSTLKRIAGQPIADVIRTLASCP